MTLMFLHPAVQFSLLFVGKLEEVSRSKGPRGMDAIPQLFRNIEALRSAELHQFIQKG